MVEYIIVCISFSIMYYFRYTREVIKDVNSSLVILEINNKFTGLIYATIKFLGSSLLMPLYLIIILRTKPEDYILIMVKSVLVEYFEINED